MCRARASNTYKESFGSETFCALRYLSDASMFRPISPPDPPAVNEYSGFEPAQIHDYKRLFWSDTHLPYPIELLLEDFRMWGIWDVEKKRVMLSFDHGYTFLSILDTTGKEVAIGTHQFWIRRHVEDPSGGFVRLVLRYGDENYWFQLDHPWSPRWKPIATRTSKFIKCDDKTFERDVFLTLVSAGC